jgi:hypothetical protein
VQLTAPGRGTVTTPAQRGGAELRTITSDGAGVFYFTFDNEIITTDLTTDTYLAGAVYGYGAADDVGGAARFDRPAGIVKVGNVLVIADTDNNTLRQVDLTSQVVTTVAGPAGVSREARNGIGAAARFDTITGLVSRGTTVYVTDATDGTIKAIDVATAAVTTVAGTSGMWGTTDGVGTGAKLAEPRGITSLGSRLFFVDSNGETVRELDPATARVTTRAGGTRGEVNGIGAAAQFDRPIDITTDGTALYVLDQLGMTVRKMDATTFAVTTVAGMVGANTCFDGPALGGATFSFPSSMVYCAGALYVSGGYCHSIRRIDLATGTVSTLAGSQQTIGYADGPGSAALFSWPNGLACDGTNLYAADGDNAVIRRIEIATGRVSTAVGTGYTATDRDGPVASALAWEPQRLSFENGRLYIANRANVRVWRQ